jgi:hypothetical protein
VIDDKLLLSTLNNLVVCAPHMFFLWEPFWYVASSRVGAKALRGAGLGAPYNPTERISRSCAVGARKIRTDSPLLEDTRTIVAT